MWVLDRSEERSPRQFLQSCQKERQIGVTLHREAKSRGVVSSHGTEHVKLRRQTTLLLPSSNWILNC
jgi:hypothetical protein